MSRINVKPVNRERDFRHDELFFSVTDRRGVIRSGNQVFARVAGYGSVEDLIGKPHNVIRHPDMPRSVFRLLWETIEDNRLFAGYVKNMATDGSYYWVMALVIPLQNSYLSVRFKPSSPYHAFIRDLYAEMLEIERKAGEDRDGRERGLLAAARHLLGALRAKGFESYDAFIQTALATEFASRNSLLSASEKLVERSFETPRQPEDSFKSGGSSKSGSSADELSERLRRCESANLELSRLFHLVEGFLSLNEKLTAKSSYLKSLASRVRLLSLNALVESNHLEADGLGLTVISDRMAKSSDEAIVLISGMNERILTLISSLREMAFAIAAAKLDIEMALFFGNELSALRGDDGLNEPARMRMGEDMSLLIDSFSRQAIRIMEALHSSKEPISLLEKSVSYLEWEIRSLNFIHMAGKIEAVRIEQAKKFKMTFDEAFRQIEVAQVELKDFTSAIASLNQHAAQIERVGKIISESNWPSTNRADSIPGERATGSDARRERATDSDSIPEARATASLSQEPLTDVFEELAPSLA